MSTTLDVKHEEKPSLFWFGSHWFLLQENGWAVGDTLESVDEYHDGKRIRIKLHHLTSFGGEMLDSEGKSSLKKADGSIEKHFMADRGIITFAQWPVGGSVQACSLTCRNWRKVA